MARNEQLRALFEAMVQKEVKRETIELRKEIAELKRQVATMPRMVKEGVAQVIAGLINEDVLTEIARPGNSHKRMALETVDDLLGEDVVVRRRPTFDSARARSEFGDFGRIGGNNFETMGIAPISSRGLITVDAAMHPKEGGQPIPIDPNELFRLAEGI